MINCVVFLPNKARWLKQHFLKRTWSTKKARALLPFSPGDVNGEMCVWEGGGEEEEIGSNLKMDLPLLSSSYRAINCLSGAARSIREKGGVWSFLFSLPPSLAPGMDGEWTIRLAGGRGGGGLLLPPHKHTG